MTNDWFTRTTWTEADQGDFFARLNRCRATSKKANCLWVQARELDKVGLSREAMALLDKMLAEYPEPFFLPIVYDLRAEIFVKFGDLENAIACYRNSFDVHRKYPNRHGQTVYDFGKLVTENKMTEYYNEALAVLREMEPPGMKFPAEIYKKNGILAIIAAHQGRIEDAKTFARLALAASTQDNSGVSYHPNFGLVKDRESKFLETIKEIAACDIKSFSN